MTQASRNIFWLTSYTSHHRPSHYFNFKNTTFCKYASSSFSKNSIFENEIIPYFYQLNFPSWKLSLKAHKIYELSQSNRSLYILSILCIPCQIALLHRAAEAITRLVHPRCSYLTLHRTSSGTVLHACDHRYLFGESTRG